LKRGCRKHVIADRFNSNHHHPPSYSFASLSAFPHLGPPPLPYQLLYQPLEDKTQALEPDTTCMAMNDNNDTGSENAKPTRGSPRMAQTGKCGNDWLKGQRGKLTTSKGQRVTNGSESAGNNHDPATIPQAREWRHNDNERRWRTTMTQTTMANDNDTNDDNK
jgi:hypothetical protein